MPGVLFVAAAGAEDDGRAVRPRLLGREDGQRRAVDADDAAVDQPLVRGVRAQTGHALGPQLEDLRRGRGRRRAAVRLRHGLSRRRRRRREGDDDGRDEESLRHGGLLELADVEDAHVGVVEVLAAHRPDERVARSAAAHVDGLRRRDHRLVAAEHEVSHPLRLAHEVQHALAFL